MNNRIETLVKQARFLIIDDEPANVRLLEGNLNDDGWANLKSTTDPRQALTLFREYKPDIVLLDLMMPYLDGFAVMEQLRSEIPSDENLPIIILTANMLPQIRDRALFAGARDFLTKPFHASELRLRVRNLLETRFLYLSAKAQNRELDARVRERTRQLEDTLIELRQTQKQIIHKARLHALGEMAGGIVHDFNNSLTVLQGYSELLMQDGMLDDPRTVREYLQMMYTAACDAGHIVKQLRHFYRPRHEDEKFELADLSKLLDEAAKLSKPKWKTKILQTGNNIDMQLDLNKVPLVSCNPFEIREVMVNLIFNAVDAMPEGGTITLRTGTSNGSSRFEISDTGFGMDEETRIRCMEPFFSTKGENGTGLGLAMVAGILRRHNASLNIRTAPGAGTVFEVTLPTEQD